ncbi:MAG: EAL domain-containing protein [Alphaproteobacteria bacterium]
MAFLVLGTMVLPSLVDRGHATPRVLQAGSPAPGQTDHAEALAAASWRAGHGLASLVVDPGASIVNIRAVLKDITIIPPTPIKEQRAEDAPPPTVPVPHRDLASGRWFMASLVNPSAEVQTRILVIQTPTLAGSGPFGAGVTGLTVEGGLYWAQGAPARSMARLESGAGAVAFAVRLAPGQATTLALRAGEGRAPYTVALWEPNSFQRVDRLVAGAKGVVVGVLIMLIALAVGRWALQGGQEELTVIAFACAGLYFVATGFGIQYTVVPADWSLAGGLRASALYVLAGVGLALVQHRLSLSRLGAGVSHWASRIAMLTLAGGVLALPGGIVAALAGPVALAISLFTAGAGVTLARARDARASALMPGLALIVLCVLAATLLSLTVPGPLADLQSIMLTGAVAAGITLLAVSSLLGRAERADAAVVPAASETAASDDAGADERGAGPSGASRPGTLLPLRHEPGTGVAPGPRVVPDASGDRSDLALEAARHGVWDLDPGSGRLVLSPVVAALLGTRPKRLGASLSAWLERVHPDDVETFRQGIEARIVQGNRSFAFLVRVLHDDQSYRWLMLRGTAVPGRDGRARRLLGIVTDETAQQETLDAGALRPMFDRLTGLAGRDLLFDRLDRVLRAQRARGPWDEDEAPALLRIDLDDFRTVNEVLGPVDADAILIAVARRLEGLVGETDTVARTGGDEFSILLAQGLGPGTEEDVGRLLADVIGAPLAVSDQDVTLSACVGLALALSEPEAEPGRNDRAAGGPRETARDLFVRAGTALARAKARGPCCTIAAPASRPQSSRPELDLDATLKAVLQGRQGGLTYQPIVDLQKSRLAGFVARLHVPSAPQGLLSTEDLVREAEDRGVMADLGLRLLEMAIGQIQDWQRRWPTEPPLFVTVEVPSIELLSLDFADELRTLVARAALPPHCLRFAVSEPLIWAQPEATGTTLRILKEDGVGLVLDDFGAGQGSLGRLTGGAFEAVTLGHGLVAGITTRPAGRLLVKGLATLTHDLGMDCIASGLETDDDVKVMRDLGLDYALGPTIGTPQMPDRAEALLARMLGPERGLPASVPEDVFGNRVEAAE